MDEQAYPNFRHPSFTGFIGVAQADITPPVGIYSRNWGASPWDTAEGIHRPLMLTCLTFQSAKQEKPLVLIAADLGWWKSAEDEWVLRSGIVKALSLTPSQLMFCLSHTHAGPSLHREDAAKPGGQFIAHYLDDIQQAAIAAAQRAQSTATLSTLTWHYGTCNLATHRDLPEKGKDRFLTGFNPDETADDTLLVGRVTNEQQGITATMVNYACHPTTLAWDNRLLSPDYVGAMRETVESPTQAPCLFLQGASGELAPAEQYVGDADVADQHGRQLGYAVLATLEGMLPPLTQLEFSQVVESGAPLAIWERTAHRAATTLSAEKVDVPLPLKPLPSLAAIEEQWRACEERVLKERLWRKRGIRQAVGDGNVVPMPLWVWRLGDSFLIGQPNEAYSAFQQALRHQLLPHAVGVMNIVNGSIGYLPPRGLYDKDSYPVWQTPFAEGSLELLTKTAIDVARKLMRPLCQ